MRVYIGSDKGGYQLKDTLKDYIEELGHEVTDLGVFEEGSMDYPDIAREVSEKVYENEGTLGILLCGLGTGMCMVANKHKGIRGVDCTNDTQAHYARAHTNANVLCLGESLVGIEVAKRIVEVFLDTSFDTEHEHMVKKIDKVHEDQSKGYYRD